MARTTCTQIPGTPVTSVNARVEPVESDIHGVATMLLNQRARLPTYLSFLVTGDRFDHP